MPKLFSTPISSVTFASEMLASSVVGCIVMVDMELVLTMISGTFLVSVDSNSKVLQQSEHFSYSTAMPEKVCPTNSSEMN